MAIEKDDTAVVSTPSTLPQIITTDNGGTGDGSKPGLIIFNTDSICSFLAAASTDQNLTLDLKNLSSSLITVPSVPYKSLKSIWIGSDPVTRPELISLLSGLSFVFTSPKPREKSEELKARLKKLAELAERKEYDELVKDITPRKTVEEPFSSYKDQLGFGLHVVLIMFTGYLVGYAAFKALFSHNPAMSAAGGITGLVGGMLVETLLFIFRSSQQDLRSAPSSTSKILRSSEQNLRSPSSTPIKIKKNL